MAVDAVTAAMTEARSRFPILFSEILILILCFIARSLLFLYLLFSAPPAQGFLEPLKLIIHQDVIKQSQKAGISVSTRTMLIQAPLPIRCPRSPMAATLEIL